MPRAVKRPYDNTRRQAQVRATRLRIIEAAKVLFIDRGYPATTLEAIAGAADTSLPTLYRLFASKPALLKLVLDVSFGGDDEPVAFGDRPEIRKARAESDPVALIRAFARIGREFMERSSAIMHVLATALSALGALDPDLGFSDAVDMTYLSLSPDVHRVLTVERGWTAEQYEQWLIRSLSLLLRPELRTTSDPGR